MGIRFQVSLLLMPLAVVPVIIIAVLAAIQGESFVAVSEKHQQDLERYGDQLKSAQVEFSDGIRQRVAADLQTLVENLGSTFDQHVTEYKRVLEISSNTPTLIIMLTSDDQSLRMARGLLERPFSVLIKTYGFSEVSVVNPQGQELLRVGGWLVPEGGDPIIDAVQVANARTDESQSAWYQTLSASTKKHCIATIYSNDDYGQPVNSLAVAMELKVLNQTISRRYGKLEGYLFASISLEIIMDKVMSEVEQDGLLYALIEKADGDLLAFSDGYESALVSAGQNDFLTVEAPVMGGQRLLRLMIPRQIVEQPMGQMRQLVTGMNEEMEGIGGLLQANQNAMRSKQIWGVVLVVSTVVMAIAMARYLSQRIANPIVQLRQMAVGIGKEASGAPSINMPLDRGDEIGDLAHSLVNMRQEIATQIHNLEATNENLREANVRAEAATRSKANFLANMSHEMRTPLNGVIGNAELLLTTDLDDRQRDMLDTLHACGEATLVVINDILDLSKIEAGEMELGSEVFDVRQTCEEVMAVLARAAIDKGIELALIVSEEVTTLYRGDPLRLRQVLINLVGNAVKFTPQGEVTLEIGVVPEIEGSLQFAVRDTGIGIDEADIDTLFAPFNQVDNSSRRGYTGTGLGLTICRQLVGLMGGDITCHSEKGVGSEFSFTVTLEIGDEWEPCSGVRISVGRCALICGCTSLQYQSLRAILATVGVALEHVDDVQDCMRRSADAEVDMVYLVKDPLNPALMEVRQAIAKNARVCRVMSYADYHDEEHEPYDIVTPFRCRQVLKEFVQLSREPQTRTIDASSVSDHMDRIPVALVVEDNAVNARLVQTMLEKIGVSVLVATNGLEGVEVWRKHQIDLVLMDCQMPVMDGFEATRKIRQLEEADQHTPIIALTANAMLTDREKCLACGMDDFSTKPIRIAALKDLLQRWLTVRPR